VNNSVQPPIQTRTISDFHRQVADHDVYCGGGSVAAVAAAGAAALIVLVLGLSVRKRSNAPIREQIEASIARSQAVHENLLLEADTDMQALQQLMEVHKQLKPGNSRSTYNQALFSAASVPLSIARHSLELLEITQKMLGASSRFTVSDLGAAAGLAIGALRAATLMCEVNLALLKDDDNADPVQYSEMLAESAQLLQGGEAIASSIDATVRATIRQE
jgi:formiminotetrahydrofolate cyclodeaminase